MFNSAPAASVLAVHIAGPQYCYVIDNALERPEEWVAFAADHREQFVAPPRNAYPGLEMRMPEPISDQFNAFFMQYIRGLFQVRRSLQMYSRLSLVTTPPQALQPNQWLCHSDVQQMPPDQRRLASVLYLFKDAGFGGTNFYAARRPTPEVQAMVKDSKSLSGEDFARKHGIAPGYPTASNAYYEKLLTIAPQWNRLIFYDGAILHSSDTQAPPAHCTDPRQGRLTLNGFFDCKRTALAMLNK